MFDTLALAASALVSMGQEAPPVYEEVFHIPAEIPFVLEVSDPSAVWDALTLFSPSGETLPEIQTLEEDGTWSDWHQEHYAEHIAPNSVLELRLFNESRSSLIVTSPVALDVVGHFFAAEKPGFWQTVANTYSPFESYGAKYKLEELKDDYQLPEPKFYSREEWGADERLRWSKTSTGLFSRASSGLPSEIDDFPSEFKPKIIEDSYEGHALSWPVAEMPELYKFVIHHTGEYVDPNVPRVKKDPFRTMRAIYYYHTITLGWGDIGYHYVIDVDGNIYEGRSGGPGAIGAHTAYYNAGSIGISLMGNFQVEDPTTSQVESLSLLIADHAQRFDIDPHGRSYYLGQLSYNISGHRDVTALGRGTACPGENLYKLIPSIRTKVKDYIGVISEGRPLQQRTRNILQKSVDAGKYQQVQSFEKSEREILSVEESGTPPRFKRNQDSTLSITVTNETDFSWPKGVVMRATNIPEGILLSSFRSQQVLAPGEKGEFTAKLRAVGITNGVYAISIDPVFLKQRLNEITYKNIAFSYPVQISGDRLLFTRIFDQDTTTKRDGFSASDLKASSFKEQQKSAVKSWKQPDTDNEIVKIKLSYLDETYINVIGSEAITVVGDNKELVTIPAGKMVSVVNKQQDSKSWLEIQDDNNKRYEAKDVRLVSEGILKIQNYDRGINSNVPFNSFRSDLKIYPQSTRKLLVVNELPIEEYLYGIAEETSKEPDEKRKAVLTLARSYVYVYGGDRRKFKTDLYDLEDSAATSQLYLGHDWERYHSSQKALVDETQGLVLYYGGVPVIGPYFTQSGGASSSKWTGQYPWTTGRVLPFDQGLEPKGHGVGLSGNSARKLAEQGKNFLEIIDYFYDGTSVKSYK